MVEQQDEASAGSKIRPVDPCAGRHKTSWPPRGGKQWLSPYSELLAWPSARNRNYRLDLSLDEFSLSRRGCIEPRLKQIPLKGDRRHADYEAQDRAAIVAEQISDPCCDRARVFSHAARLFTEQCAERGAKKIRELTKPMDGRGYDALHRPGNRFIFQSDCVRDARLREAVSFALSRYGCPVPAEQIFEVQIGSFYGHLPRHQKMTPTDIFVAEVTC